MGYWHHTGSLAFYAMAGNLQEADREEILSSGLPQVVLPSIVPFYLNNGWMLNVIFCHCFSVPCYSPVMKNFSLSSPSPAPFVVLVLAPGPSNVILVESISGSFLYFSSE